MAFFAMFPTILKTYEKRNRRFQFQDLSYIRLNSNWTLCRNVLVFSNRAPTSRSSNIEIILAIAPLLVPHLVQLLLRTRAEFVLSSHDHGEE